MLETLLGCLIGAVITWLVSYAYYKRAGDDLKCEAQKLHDQTQLILIGLEQGGLVELHRVNGAITGFKRWIVRPKGIESSKFGKPTVGHAPSYPSSNWFKSFATLTGTG